MVVLLLLLFSYYTSIVSLVMIVWRVYLLLTYDFVYLFDLLVLLCFGLPCGFRACVISCFGRLLPVGFTGILLGCYLG